MHTRTHQTHTQIGVTITCFHKLQTESTPATEFAPWLLYVHKASSGVCCLPLIYFSLKVTTKKSVGWAALELIDQTL